MIAPHPIDSEPGMAGLSEAEAIRREFGWSNIAASIIILYPPTIDSVRRTLRARQWDVVHFAGHGSDRGLLFENDDGFSDWIDTDRLLDAIQDTDVRLLYLSCCESDGPGEVSVPSGVRSAIVCTGQFDSASASAVATSVYAALTTGAPLSEALNRARDQANRSWQREVLDYSLRLFGAENHVLVTPTTVRGQAEIIVPRPMHNLKWVDFNRSRDREIEQQKIARLLSSSGSPFIGVTGLPGVGKTHIMRAAAWRFGWRFPGGVSYASSREGSVTNWSDTFAHLDWNLDDVRPSARTNVVAVEMAQGPSLLIVDDLESASDRELRQLCDLCERIDASFGCHIILGMRVRRPEFDALIPDDDWLEVDRLPADDATAIFDAIVDESRRRLDLGTAERRRLVGLCRGHPQLLIRTASALTLGVGAASIATHLTQNGPAEALQELFGPTIQQVEELNPVVRQLLDAWVVFETSITEDALIAVAAPAELGTDERVWRSGVEGLVRSNLVDRLSDGFEERLGLHPLFADYLNQHRWSGLAESSVAAYARRLCGFLLRRFNMLEPPANDEQRFVMILSEWPNLLNAVRLAGPAGLHLVSYLVGGGDPLLLRSNQWAKARDLADLALDPASGKCSGALLAVGQKGLQTFA